MPTDTLEFEEPIAVLLKEIEALSLLPQTPERAGEIASLHRRIESIRADIYAHLTPWQRVLVARHPARPTVLDYVARLFTEFIEISGVVHGEGGSGGALGLAVGDHILMHEFAIYSVIPPEGCAAILWRDANRKVEAAEALKLTAPDLVQLRIIDEIVREPVGGAHTNPERAATLLDPV